MLLALALIAQDAATPTAAASDEVVVIGNRLKMWRGSFKSRGGRIVCKTTASTGDVAVDAIGCDAMTVCLSPVAAQMDAAARGPGSEADRQRAWSALLQSRVPCMADARRAGVARLAAERKPS